MRVHHQKIRILGQMLWVRLSLSRTHTHTHTQLSTYSFASLRSTPSIEFCFKTCDVEKNTGSNKAKSDSSTIRCINTDPTIPRQPTKPTFIIMILLIYQQPNHPSVHTQLTLYQSRKYLASDSRLVALVLQHFLLTNILLHL